MAAFRWDPTLERLYGLEPGTFGGTFDDWATLVHPEDRQRLLDTVQRAMASGTPVCVRAPSGGPRRIGQLGRSPG